MPDQPIPTRKILNGPAVHAIRMRVNLHAKLLTQIQNFLPPALAKHCLSCVYREDKILLLYLDTQTAATQVRFRLPSILSKLNASNEFPINLIKLRSFAQTLAPSGEVESSPVKAPRAKTIAAIKASCSEAPTDDPLAQALARLASSMERYAAKSKK